jgi:hypothetical protein
LPKLFSCGITPRGKQFRDACIERDEFLEELLQARVAYPYEWHKAGVMLPEPASVNNAPHHL